jgi:methylated-DNA-[protein]-cysteine S-methyltransferase
MPETYSTYYHSPVGLLKISGSDEYISEVSFQEARETAGEPQAHLPSMLIECTEQLIQYFNGERRIFEIPIHQPGTPFQQDVWNMLAQIPFGKTISYLDLARRSGDIKATRAVANANGKNNIAIIIPCHRVIGSNNTLVGYAGGLWRKKWLLELEAKVAHGVQTLF